MNLVSSYNQDGFIIVRQLFTPEEVSDIRNSALSLPQDKKHLDLLSIPTLSHVLLDKRVLGVFRELIGEDLVYYGDSNVSINAPSHGFHKDNPDRNDPNGPDWIGDYPLVRFGLYTQSHKGLPEGLDLRQGSHLHASIHKGKHVQADTEPGDVVFWNARTTHSGFGMTVLGRPVDPSSIAGRLIWKFPALRDKPKVKRAVLFGTLAAPGSHLERYILSLKSREYGVKQALDSRHDPAALKAAAAAGVSVRDMKLEVTERPYHTVRADHWQIPY